MWAVCQSVDECILAQWWRRGLQMSVSGSVHESDKRFQMKTFDVLWVVLHEGEDTSVKDLGLQTVQESGRVVFEPRFVSSLH